MLESQKRMRLEMVRAGLEALLKDSNAQLSRKAFFTKLDILGMDDKKKAIAQKEFATKSWQTATLNRLVNEGIIENIGNEYKLGTRSKCQLIVDDYNNNGTALAYFIFPNEVAPPSFANLKLDAPDDNSPT